MKINQQILSIFTILLLTAACQSLPSHESDPSRGSKVLTQNQDTRGGNSQGAPVTKDTEPSPFFVKLKQAKSKKEKDRLAILSQTGEYQVHFEFIETLSLKDQKRAKPYYSWATEYIFPITNKKDFVSLQHILVMQSEDESGQLSEPVIVKHWRQDWSYQDPTGLEYLGFNTWKKSKLSPKQVQGRWSQMVYQVDDSPRYQAIGQWQHFDDFSVWESERAARPLPRREKTARSDYQRMDSLNRVTVNKTGWFHEQDNNKVMVERNNLKPTTIIAREIGLNRYERIKGFDFQPGKDYWEKTKSYWGLVRNHWEKVISENSQFSIKEKVDNKKLYQLHFAFAKELQKKEKNDLDQKQHARKTIESFLQ